MALTCPGSAGLLMAPQVSSVSMSGCASSSCSSSAGQGGWERGQPWLGHGRPGAEAGGGLGAR